MRNRLVAVVIVALVVISILGVSIVLQYPLDESGFQFERAVTSTTPDSIFFQIRADDADVSITFTENDNLLYSINITPYLDSTEAGISIVMTEDSWGVTLRAGRQKSIDIVLGTGCFYFINIVASSNLNTTIVYSNNAWVNDTALHYGVEDGDLNLRIHNNIKVNDTIGFDVWIWCRTLNLDIDVPFEWNAFVDFHSSNLTILEMTGWHDLYGEYAYRTDDVYDNNPIIEIDVDVEEAFAWLRT